MTTANPTQYAAIYARVSTEDQGKGFSIPTQIDGCQKLVAHEGYTVREGYILMDEGISGTTMDRPGLRTLRELVNTKAISAVIVYDPDRLSRNLGHQLLLAEEMERASVKLLIVSYPMEQGPEGWLFFQMRGALAEYERAKILERTKRGMVGRAKAGYPAGGQAPLGYRSIQELHRGRWEVDPEEAALVQRIFGLYVEHGLSLKRIAEQLTRERVPTHGTRLRRKTAHGVWHVECVRSLLTNETYIGTMFYGKRQRIAGKGNPDKKTRWRAVPREEWIPISVRPVIDQITFRAAQAQLIRNAKTSCRNRKYEYLFVGGRLKCGQCGRSMPGYQNGRGVRAYRCSLHPYQALALPHTRRSLTALPIETAVWGSVETVLRNPTRIAQELERRRSGTSAQQADLNRERGILMQTLQQCEKDLQRWELAYLGEAINLEDFKGKKAEIMVRRTSIEQALARFDEQQGLLERAHIETASLQEYCARVNKNLNRFDLAEKQRALGALNIAVTWHPEKPLDIQGSIPVTIATNAVG